MNVQIRTAYGEMSFDMTQDKVMSLLGLAITYAKGEEPTEEPEPPRVDMERRPEPTPAEQPSTDVKKTNRLERMFGARDGWNMPAAPEKTQEAEQPAETRKEWRGFLYIECEDCGEVKGFYSKHELKFHRCKCGHHTGLNDQRAAHVRCKCGGTFTYKTNKREDRFTIDCLDCGAPVNLELGKRGTAYVTVDEIDGGESS